MLVIKKLLYYKDKADLWECYHFLYTVESWGLFYFGYVPVVTQERLWKWMCYFTCCKS